MKKPPADLLRLDKKYTMRLNMKILVVEKGMSASVLAMTTAEGRYKL